jgi:hypothetical protein
MDATSGTLGPFETTGYFGWALPVALMLLPGTVLALVALAAFRASLPCEMDGRILASVVASAATGGGCLGVAAFRSAPARALAFTIGALAAAALALAVGRALFAFHC